MYRSCLQALLPLLLASSLPQAPALARQGNGSGNMNPGSRYLIANPLPDAATPFDTDWGTKDAEFFEVYAGPIETRYGEVFWQGLPAVPLPPDLVARFDDGVMAVVGYEQDQVVRVDGKPDQRVPITAVYNHHYVAWLKGKAATMVTLDGTDTTLTGHPLHQHAYAINDPNPDSVIPSSQFFSEGNGGESRKSYHGYPRGMAQLLDSPTHFIMTPMQIDTWNRNRTFEQSFVPGPEPRESQAPRSGPDRIYSGHLECPCTDRIIKSWEQVYSTLLSGVCGTSAEPLTDADTCFAGGQAVYGNGVTSNKTVDDPSLPSGCSFIATLNASKKHRTGGEGDGDQGVVVYFNTAKSAVECGTGQTSPRVFGRAQSLVTFSLELTPPTTTRGGGGKDSLTDGGQALLTLSGPADVWFGVGLGAQSMADTPNAIIVLGNGTVFEEKLDNQAAGVRIATSVTVLSSSVVNNTRTVVLSRALQGQTPDHFSFNLSDTSLSFINALGKTGDFAYHASRVGAVLHLSKDGAATCVCDGGVNGYIASDQNPERQLFNKQCLPEPYGDLLRLKNPTCFLKTYQGGLHCCTSGNILLDADQNPWPEPEHRLAFWMKWRFYFQEFKNSTTTATHPKPGSNPDQATKRGPGNGVPSHQNLVRFFHDGGGAGEYDVVKAPEGTAPEDRIYQITTHIQVKDGVAMCNARTSPHCAGPAKAGITLVYASGHCHAPSCLKMELWNADTGERICLQTPHIGQSDAPTADEPYDERGYIAVPPCLYGDKEEGLLPPHYLSYDTNLTFVKWNNNTYGHLGEMAMWQMRGYQAYDPEA